MSHRWCAAAWEGPIRRSFCEDCGVMRIERTNEGRSGTGDRRSNGERLEGEYVRTTTYLVAVRDGGCERAGEPDCRRS